MRIRAIRTIAGLRKMQGLTQAQLGEILGITQSGVANFETGDNTLPSVFIRYAAALGFRVEPQLVECGGAVMSADEPSLAIKLPARYAMRLTTCPLPVYANRTIDYSAAPEPVRVEGLCAPPPDFGGQTVAALDTGAVAFTRMEQPSPLHLSLAQHIMGTQMRAL
jgi:transcriptional regulator with XRE-family HTH domain